MFFLFSAEMIFPYAYSSNPFAILSAPGSIWFVKIMKYELISGLILVKDSSAAIS